MNSDDDGFCEAFTIVRMTESKPDDLSALHQRGFIFLVDSKVCIVKDWHTNNDIRVDRYSRSKYLDKPEYADVYGVIMEDKIKHLSRYKAMLPNGSTNGSTQVRLGKDNTSVANAPQERVYEDENSQKPRSAAKYPHSKEVFSWFPKDLVEPSWKTNTTILKHSELLHDRGEKAVRGIIKFCLQNESDAFFPAWQDPTALERNWTKIIKFAERNGL